MKVNFVLSHLVGQMFVFLSTGEMVCYSIATEL